MKQILPIVLLVVSSTTSNAQIANIHGTVKDTTGHGVVAANVALLKAADSSWVASATTMDNGVFTFNKIAYGKYLLEVNAIGYTKIQKSITILNDNPNEVIVMRSQAHGLKEVVVSAQKPFIEAGLGKTIVNVDGNITTAGTNALEVLKRSPGVTVDNNGNISLDGQQGVLVLVDNKKTYLSGEQLVDYLKSLSSDEIAKLELITQPCAKYDAEGTGGIINIKTKKVKKHGFNGSMNIAGSQGIYPGTHNNVQLNYRKNDLTLTLNTGYLWVHGFMNTIRHTKFHDLQTDAITGTFDQNVTENEIFDDFPLKLGADYDVSKKMSVGISVKGIYHTNHNWSSSNATITDINNGTSYNVAANHASFIRHYGIVNSYMQYTFNKAKESELDLNFDYLYYHIHTYNNVDNNNYDAQGNPTTNNLVLKGDIPLTMNDYTFRADYSIKPNKSWKIEAGVKSSLTKNDDDNRYDMLDNGVWVNDTVSTNHFIYKENVNALYCSAQKEMGKKWEAQLGLRAENANTYGNQITQKETFNRHSTALFPTAYVQYSPNDKNQLQLNYGRRISRPDYSSLDPFRTYVSQYFYEVGNPYLLPQYTNRIGFQHVYNHELITKLSYSHSSHSVDDLQVQDDSTKITYHTMGNVGSADIISLSVNYNKDVTNWWNLSLSGYAFYATFIGVNGYSNLKQSGTGYGGSLNTKVKLGKGWKTEGYVYCQGRSIWSVMNRVDPNVYIGFGVSKSMMNDTAIVKLNISDPFYVYHNTEYSRGGTTDTEKIMRWDPKTVALSFNYNFGKMMHDIHQRNSQEPEEARRMGM